MLLRKAHERGWKTRVLEPKIKLSQVVYLTSAGRVDSFILRNSRCELVNTIGALIGA